MKVIVGLGNIGASYKKTRHNVGFMVVDHLSKKYHIPVKEGKYKAAYGKGTINNQEVMIVKPLTYMNLSGEAVKKISYKFSTPVQNLLVVYDEIDLVLGKIKKKTGGGAAGHRGIKSIIQSLNDRDFTRIRVGIGRPLDNSDISDWVLSPFAREEMLIVKESISLAVQIIEEFL